MQDETPARQTDEQGAVPARGGVSRRRLLQGIAAAAGLAAAGGIAGGAVAATSGGSSQAADFVLPPGFSGTMADLKHVVILMLENRSFDHMLGQLPGVRGHSDKQALEFQDGTNVFSQRDASGNVVGPYYSNSQGAGSLNHSFYGANGGRWNTWVPDKGTTAMRYFGSQDIPFMYSLASQYTVCDQNFCSVHGPTYPNRLHLMSGWANGEVTNGSPDYSRTWVTVPEQLQQAGIDWRTFSDNSTSGTGWIGDYACNMTHWFKNFKQSNASAADLLAPTGKVWRGNSFDWAATGVPNTTDNLPQLLADFTAACQPGAQYPLPAVSWLIAPSNYSEHPSWTPEDGSRFLQASIAALQSNPDIWNHTLFILTYDENDGMFDHVLPPRPDAVGTSLATSNDWSGSTPIGFGPRIPMLLVSPWTRGGYVSSEVYDHTSTIRFLEVWAAYQGKPFTCTNITPWRRAVSGDLTNALDFAHPQVGPATFADPTNLVALPGLTADKMKRRDIAFHAHSTVTENRSTGQVTATMTMAGGPSGKALSLQVFPDNYLAFSNSPFTVTTAAPRTYTWDATKTDGKYAFTIHGNDGFVRSFAGALVPAGQADIGIARADVELVSGSDAKLKITLYNDGNQPVLYSLTANDYLGSRQGYSVAAGKSTVIEWPTEQGCYDVIITAANGTGWTQRYAGRVATI